ncbi:hypothetical protein PFISCL1PPCAC_25001, partial [Pristionchus fissidentatus]
SFFYRFFSFIFFLRETFDNENFLNKDDEKDDNYDQTSHDWNNLPSHDSSNSGFSLTFIRCEFINSNVFASFFIRPYGISFVTTQRAFDQSLVRLKFAIILQTLYNTSSFVCTQSILQIRLYITTFTALEHILTYTNVA